jgi:broad specificity phosphatase PhoE
VIYLARHGETTWNLAGRYQGRLESALSALGVQQGIALSEYFVQRLARDESVPERVVSSPLLRCSATAQFSATRLDLPVETDDRLIEIAHGTWEGRYREELARNDPERYAQWRGDPAHVSFEGGETLAEVSARWEAFAAHLLAQPDEEMLVVTHDAVVRVALLALEERPLDDFWNVPVENAAFARIERSGGGLRLIEACHTEHLAGLRASVTGQAL